MPLGHDRCRLLTGRVENVRRCGWVDLVQNPLQDQWKPIFGAMYRRLAVADDWDKIPDQQRAARLREAMAAEDKMHGRPSRFSEDFDFVAVVRDIAIP